MVVEACFSFLGDHRTSASYQSGSLQAHGSLDKSAASRDVHQWLHLRCQIYQHIQGIAISFLFRTAPS